jgi:hypothetical protein
MRNAVFWDVFCMALVRTDVSVDCTAFIMNMPRICELGAALAVTSNRKAMKIVSNCGRCPNQHLNKFLSEQKPGATL